jgi:hypothetical protein
MIEQAHTSRAFESRDDTSHASMPYVDTSCYCAHRTARYGLELRERLRQGSGGVLSGPCFGDAVHERDEQRKEVGHAQPGSR